MTETPTTDKKVFSELDAIYNDGISCDSEVFSEMRSNLLLIAGEHYNRKQSAFFQRIRDSKELSDQQKLRLTKNHIQNITKRYANNILSMAPGVGFEPKNQSELQDQKAAELHQAIWMDAKERYHLDELIDDWCDDFVGIGEVAVKIFFDPNGGDIKGYAPIMDETGAPVLDESGQPQASEDAIHSGEFVFETLQGFNILRPSEAKDIRKASVLVVRKMTDKDELVKQFPEYKQLFQESMDETMVVFDNARGGYRKAKNEVLVREFFFRPCGKYPEGYYYYTTKAGIFAEGTLPGGVFPIVLQPFEKIQTTPRGRSAVKHMRPYQAEINRAASKMAEHQITLGDDKLLIQNGTKISAGVALPGVRSINYTGMAPTILAGRDGSQYLNYMTSQIQELYQVMNVEEDSMEKQNGQMDPYALLFRSGSQKKRFQRYVKRFERFLIEVARTYIKLAKVHMPDDMIVLAVGKSEQVNIPEFKNSQDLSYQIKLEAQSEDMETKMGRQLVLNHLVQYTGTKLDKEDIGKMVRLMPYANMEEGLSDLTMDYDAATNDLLALDRGQLPPIHEYDNHKYMVKRLVARMRMADFQFLAPPIQQNYVRKIQAHEQMETDEQQKILAANSEYIPTGGYMVVCDIYVGDPANPDKTRRARIPYEAIAWLVKRLEAQGQSLDDLESMNQGAVSQMAQMLLQRRQGAGSNGMAPGPAQQPAMAPQG